MSVQTTYGWSTTIGEAGGIIDIAPYEIDSFTNEAATGALKFGVAVVKGANAGKGVKLPTNTSDGENISNSVAADFEGIVVNRRTSEYDMDGKVRIPNKSTVSTMRYGRIYARVATGVTPSYGDAVYMVITGNERGYLTNSSSGTVAIKGRFLGTVDAANRIAPVEIFNGSSPSAS